MATEAISPPPAPAPSQKVSRYRSVRRAQEQQPPHHPDPDAPAVPPMPPMPAVPEMPAPQNDAPVSRSMSRYHRRPTASHATPPPLPALQANPSQSHQAPPPVQPQTSTARSRAASSSQQTARSDGASYSRPRTARQRGEVSSPEGSPQASHSANSSQQRSRAARQRGEAPSQTGSRQQSLQNDDTARQLLLKERERQRLLKEKYEAEARAQREAKQAELDRQERIRREQEEAARLEAQREAEEAEALRRQKEEKKAEQERGKKLRKAEAQKILQQREEEAARARQEEKERRARQEERDRKAKQEQEQARKAPSSSPPVSPPRHDNFGMFKRRKDPLTPDSPEESSRPPRISLSGDRETAAIRPGGGGIVPGIDAPTSAVNAGERRVSVVCGSKRIMLPITPTTTPLDLIKTAATVLTEPIDVRTAVMQELFVKVGIIRPLRNYEYVRDVMNSWDSDNQNDLSIVHAGDGGIDQDDLLAYKVPATRPEGMSCFIHYSSRPGKWSKRYITLRPDGQLVMAKNEKTKEKDVESVLTMTDYDIYSVTEKKLAKVKPPKRLCFCVKSLRKSNIFADESQFVHFFSTSDEQIATMFYKNLQHWRSWYLKHELGEGVKKKTPVGRLASGGDLAPSGASHSRGESVGSHYQLGEFTSLLDMDAFNKRLDDIQVHRPGEYPEDRPLASLDTRALHQRNKSLRVKQPPPTAFNRSAPALDTPSQANSRQNSMRRSVDLSDETFAPGGLLGRNYTQRQVSAQEREQRQNGPFTEGPSLISGMDSRLAALAATDSGLNRRSSVRSTHQRTSSDLKRSASKRAPGMPEPLIDLTPTYKPPPQHANKGKGYNPNASAGPLVESATSPEEAIRLPPSSDWRARVAASKGHGAGGGHERTKSIKHRGEPLAAYTHNNHTCAPDDDREGFTGGGLLSTAGYSQGYAPVGRGVMDGSKARGPMIDLGRDGGFAQGGLLAQVPDSGGPVIDRSGK